VAGGDNKQALHREAEELFAGKSKKAKAFFQGVQGCASLHVLDAWWRTAGPGDEFIYCEAIEPIRNDETWRRAGELAREGFLRTHERLRAGGGKQYYAVRTSKRFERQADPIEAALADPATDLIFRALKRAANLGLACPSDTDLARAAGLDQRQKAQWRVRRLIDLELISSEVVYDSGVPSRVVTIVAGKHAGPAGNKFTALPKKWAELQRSAARDVQAAPAAGRAR
jgi:hypothetical protein